MAIAYWGRKSKEYMQEILKLYPMEEVDTVVDACMGSGSFSENVSCQLTNVKCIGIELDRGIYILHKVIKEQYEELLDKMITCNYNEEFYFECRRKTREFNHGKGEYSEVEIALAELVILFFSYNGMRGNTPRRFDSYKKHQGAEKKKNEMKLKNVYDRFFMRAPGNIVSIHSKWQRLHLIYGSFMDYKEFWENPKAWIFIDPPYELSKRGIEEHRIKDGVYLGYDCDMCLEEHDKFINALYHYYRENRLQAKMMICTNYELDESGKMHIPANDRYSKLLDIGFVRMTIQNKACSNTYYSTEEKGEGTKKRRHRKIEVVYINYRTIL